MLTNTGKAGFYYAGIASYDMGLSVSNATTQTSPEYDITFEEVLGRDGDLTVDNKRLKSYVYPIHVNLVNDQNIDWAVSEISKWLKEDVRYKPLNLTWDPDYTYQAVFYEQYEITDMLPTFGKISLNFRVHPIKYRTDSLVPIEVVNGSGLFNPELRSAKPLIQVEGSGDITLQNNGEDWLVLRGVDGSVTVDSGLQVVYKGNRNEFSKMASNLSPLFPELVSGENLITWTGNVSKLTVEPRWEAIT